MSSPQQFITERKYLINISAASLVWYEQSFKRFEGALESKAAVIQRIGELRERGLSPVSVNVHLRAINAYFRWLHLEHGRELVRIPRLIEEKKILATLTPEQVQMLLRCKVAMKTNLRRAHLVALTILDTGLRASEVVGLSETDADMDNLVFKVAGKGRKQRLIPFSSELRKQMWRYTVQKKSRREKIVYRLVFQIASVHIPNHAISVNSVWSLKKHLYITEVLNS